MRRQPARKSAPHLRRSNWVALAAQPRRAEARRAGGEDHYAYGNVKVLFLLHLTQLGS